MQSNNYACILWADLYTRKESKLFLIVDVSKQSQLHRLWFDLVCTDPIHNRFMIKLRDSIFKSHSLGIPISLPLCACWPLKILFW